MDNISIYVDKVAQRSIARAMCDRANSEAMRRMFGEPAPRRFTLRLQPSGCVLHRYGMNEHTFVNSRAALAYIGAMKAVGEYVDRDGISGQYRIGE